MGADLSGHPRSRPRRVSLVRGPRTARRPPHRPLSSSRKKFVNPESCSHLASVPWPWLSHHAKTLGQPPDRPRPPPTAPTCSPTSSAREQRRRRRRATARAARRQRGAAATRSGRRKERQTRSVSRSSFGDNYLRAIRSEKERPRRDEGWRLKAAALLGHTVQQNAAARTSFWLVRAAASLCER